MNKIIEYLIIVEIASGITSIIFLPILILEPTNTNLVQKIKEKLWTLSNENKFYYYTLIIAILICYIVLFGIIFVSITVRTLIIGIKKMCSPPSTIENSINNPILTNV
jgi:peptidoglycan/LPS O-acetylase OafA/YrhL